MYALYSGQGADVWGPSIAVGKKRFEPEISRFFTTQLLTSIMDEDGGVKW